MSYDPFASTTPVQNEPKNQGMGLMVAIIVSAIVVAAVLVVGAVWLLTRDSGGDIAAASPSPSAEVSVTPTPSPSAEVSVTPTPSPSFVADQDALARAEVLGFSPVAHELDIDDIHEYYSEAFSSGRMFEELIPHTEDGVNYAAAFMYKVTDYKAAGRFGGEFDKDRRDELAKIELQFLTVSDLDFTVKYTRTDGSVFEHDGTAPDSSAP